MQFPRRMIIIQHPHPKPGRNTQTAIRRPHTRRAALQHKAQPDRDGQHQTPRNLVKARIDILQAQVVENEAHDVDGDQGPEAEGGRRVPRGEREEAEGLADEEQDDGDGELAKEEKDGDGGGDEDPFVDGDHL